MFVHLIEQGGCFCVIFRVCKHSDRRCEQPNGHQRNFIDQRRSHRERRYLSHTKVGEENFYLVYITSIYYYIHTTIVCLFSKLSSQPNVFLIFFVISRVLNTK